MKVPLSSPLKNYLSHKSLVDSSIERALQSGDYILGREIEDLEKEFSEFLGVKDVVAVASGTDALALSLRSLDVSRGDEVITVSHSAVAVVSAIEQVGATPVLVDIENDFYTIDFARVSQMTTAKTAAVIAVHLYGQAVDMFSALKYQSETGIPVIEDCSQAHGATWQGQRLGSFGILSAFSCYPTKNLGAFGDAGLIATQDAELGLRLRRLRQYGWREKQHSLEPGVNSRMDEIQAAILRVQLRTLDLRNARRREIAETYLEALAELPIEIGSTRDNCEPVYHLFVCELQNRDKFRLHLAECGVQTGIHYPVPIHLQTAYLGRLKQGLLERTEAVSKNVVSLPMFPELSDSDVAFVVDAIRRFYE
jgi:dTDP-4-amino-4,6-dideoxygalactose transaminase